MCFGFCKSGWIYSTGVVKIGARGRRRLFGSLLYAEEASKEICSIFRPGVLTLSGHGESKIILNLEAEGKDK